MGNRGSKSSVGTDKKAVHISESVNTVVKEQRVDGSFTSLKSTGLVLRCTRLCLFAAGSNANLLNFERNFLIKNLSNQVVKRNYTTRVVLSECLNKQSFANFQIFNPWFITGFTDALLKKVAGINQFSTKRRVSNNLSLVVWGANLTSLVGNGRFTKQERNMIKLAPYQMSVIIGLLLSDGWLTFASKTNKNARLGFKQSLSRSAYVWFVFNILSHYCSSSPQLIKNVRLGNQLYALQFFTRSLPCFTELHTLFYREGVKIIPDNIYEILTPIALAHVIMGDGSAKKYSLKICLDSYTILDVIRFMNVLIIRYELDCTLHFHTPTQPRIHIKQKSMPKLRAIVEPFTHESMMYKLGIYQ